MFFFFSRNKLAALALKALLAALILAAQAVLAEDISTPSNEVASAEPKAAAIQVTDSGDKEREQRLTQFRDIQRYLKRRQYSRAKAELKKMSASPLRDYLQLDIFLTDLYRVPKEDVESFIELHAGSWIGEKARLRWLPVLSRRKRYRDFIEHYQHAFMPSAGLQCRYADALYRTGKMEDAFKLAEQLWLVGRSQPDECDSIFKVWRSHPDFNEDFIWQRYLLARKARKYSLARYLASLPKSDLMSMRVKSYQQVRANPGLVLKETRYIEKAVPLREVIEYGLRRLARNTPLKAQEGLQRFSPHADFSDEQYSSVVFAITQGFALKGDHEQAISYAQQQSTRLTGEKKTAIVDWHLRDRLKKQDWQQVLNWLALLPEEAAVEDRWLYWQARARNQLGQSSAEAYGQLAKRRSFYGLLSALLTEQPPDLNHNPIQVSDAQLDTETLKRTVELTRDLDTLKYYLNARQTWASALYYTQTKEQKHALALTAHRESLYYQAIISMAQAISWNDLDVRFPLAYSDIFKQAADDVGVDLSWLYAISRQESAFAVDVRSSANAMGLIQILPATAREMAKKLRIPYRKNRLKEPAYNVPLGAAYLKEGKAQLRDNVVYATAGYNAGISRARSWLKNGGDQLPLDIWVETIPFEETRKYVKNVMVYAEIYASKTQSESPFLAAKERWFIGLP